MLKNYPVKTAPTVQELKDGPSAETLNRILQYSKGVTAKKVKGKKVLFHLN
jgi:hypothetical protein